MTEMSEKEKIRQQFAEMLRKNKKIVDKYLEMEYNTLLDGLVNHNNDIQRGKAQFIRMLLGYTKPRV